jgi:membrane protein
VGRTLHEVIATSGKLTFGLLFALYSRLAGMTQRMSTLNAVYEVREKRSSIRVHLISLGLTLGMSILIIAALFFVLAGGQLVERFGPVLGWNSVAIVLIRLLGSVLALGFVMFVFATVYYFAPDVEHQRWYWITPGSWFAVALWAIVSSGLQGYLHFFQ